MELSLAVCMLLAVDLAVLGFWLATLNRNFEELCNYVDDLGSDYENLMEAVGLAPKEDE